MPDYQQGQPLTVRRDGDEYDAMVARTEPVELILMPRDTGDPIFGVPVAEVEVVE